MYRVDSMDGMDLVDRIEVGDVSIPSALQPAAVTGLRLFYYRAQSFLSWASRH